MSSFHPTMKMITSYNEEMDDMYNVHGHVGDLSRFAILDYLKKILSSKSASSPEQAIAIADFGTADGKAVFSLVNEMIDIIKTELGKEQGVVVYYNDQPMNDFNRLSKVIQVDRQNSGQTTNKNVYSVIVPKTMFAQCLPNNTLDLALSAVASHYLSKQVCQIKNGICLTEADEIEQKIMKEQARIDWRTFVISRGRELKPGGVLITMNISSDDNDDEPMVVDKGVNPLGGIVSDMAAEGIITKEEYLATNFHSYYLRKPADFKEPFACALPEVKELGLELVSVKSIKHYLQHPIFNIEMKDEAEQLEYSNTIVASLYPWMHHILWGRLSISRTEAEKQTIIDQFFDRLQTYAFAHSDHKPYHIFTEVIIKKSL